MMITKEEAKTAYENLIQFRKANVLIKSKSNPGQIENHHIVPISCNGNDTKENKVSLLAKEHFMAHVYLWIMHHDDEFHFQTTCALNKFIQGSVHGHRKELRNFILESLEYQKAREEFAKLCSVNMSLKVKGKSNPSFGKHWYKDPDNLENYGLFYEGEQPRNWIKGRTQPKTLRVLNQLEKFTNKGKKEIHNPKTGQRKYIYSGDPIPKGFVNFASKRTEDEKRKISETLKSKTTSNPEFLQAKINYLRPRYKMYLENGFEEMKKCFSYEYSYPNFSMACKKYLPEFVPYLREKKTKYNII